MGTWHTHRKFQKSTDIQYTKQPQLDLHSGNSFLKKMNLDLRLLE